mgnify:CR=1 FL=1
MIKRSRSFRLLLLGLFGSSALLWTGCESTQGAVNAPRATTVGSGDEEIKPAPKSVSYSDKKDVFQAAEYESDITSAYPNARQIRLQVGEVLEVYRGSARIGDGQPEMAFYLPQEATAIVRLIVEREGSRRTYFLRGIAPGESVGGVVEKEWLNRQGTGPRDAADEARVQNAIRGEPFLILVE